MPIQNIVGISYVIHKFTLNLDKVYLLRVTFKGTFYFRDKQFRDVSMCSLLFLSPVFGIPTFFTRILRPVTSHNQWRPVSDVSLDGVISGKNLQCESSESEMELERFKRLVYTLHPKATSLRMHSMRKRRVTTKFTMVKKSNKTAGASWYYKIHPTHRRNTT